MKLRFLSLAACVAGAGIAYSLPRGEPTAPAAQDSFHAGPPHQRLQGLAGTWDAVVIVRGPTGEEQRTRGTLTTETLADFHTVDRFEGELMGMKFVGHGVNGYCAVRRQYFTFWTDSMTSSPMSLAGDFDEASAELRLKGECYGMSGKLEPCRTVLHLVDGDHSTFTLYGAGPDGTDVEHLRIEYTRRPAGGVESR